MCYGGRNTRGMGFKAMITNDFCISINRILICNTAAFDIGSCFGAEDGSAAPQR